MNWGNVTKEPAGDRDKWSLPCETEGAVSKLHPGAEQGAGVRCEGGGIWDSLQYWVWISHVLRSF